jgi:hypothetical protein
MQDQVLAMGSRLWGPMTLPVPNGMGPPIPDTGDNGGNGKIDIYVLGAARCVVRENDVSGGACRGIDEAGGAVAAAVPTSPDGAPGRPEASSGFLLLSKDRLGSPSIVADLAHEFFHVLQFAHHSPAFQHWYVEASATWAEWVYARDETTTDVYAAFRKFQRNDLSLLEFDGAHEYHSWVWPLFQADHAGMGAPSVFSTWRSFESLTTAREFDAAIDESLPFESFFRDFAVTNLQPQPYRPRSSTGLEAVTWQQLDADRRSFPRNEHVLTNEAVPLRQGNRPTVTSRYRANVVALAAQSDGFIVRDAKVQQITIDVSGLTNPDNVDLDVVGRLDGAGDDWVRIAATDDEVTFCRNVPTEDFDRFYVVISNHAFARRGEGPSPAQRVAGRYSIETHAACDLTPTTFTGTARAELTTLFGGDVIVGQEVITVDMSGTFTLDRRLWQEEGATIYDFAGEVIYSYEAYGPGCARIWTEPTAVPGEGYIQLYTDVWGVLTYIGTGEIPFEYDASGYPVPPEVERHYQCDPEKPSQMVSTGGAPPWFRGHAEVRVTSDGLQVKGEWTQTSYLDDPRSTVVSEWDFVGECPCPPAG